MFASQQSSLLAPDGRRSRRAAARSCAGLRNSGGSSQDAEVAAAVAVAMAPACALGSASSAPSLGCAEQFGVDDVPGSNGLAAVANAVTGSASALSARSDTEGTAFDSPWGAESASILRQCRLLTTPFQPPARTRPSSSDGGSSVQAAPARLSSSADSFESAQSVAFPCSVAMPSMSVESASGISVGGRLPLRRAAARLGSDQLLQRRRGTGSVASNDPTGLVRIAGPGDRAGSVVAPSATVEVLPLSRPPSKRPRMAAQHGAAALAPPPLAPAGTLAGPPAPAAKAGDSAVPVAAAAAAGARGSGRRASRHAATSRNTPPRRPSRTGRAATPGAAQADAGAGAGRPAAAALPAAAAAGGDPCLHPLWRSPVCWAWADDRTYVKTDIEVIAQAPTHAEKLAAAARFFGIGPDAGPRTTVVTKAKGGASLTFSAFWPASPAECNALLDQTVAAAERVEGCRKRVCRICDPASPRTNFRRHLEQHMGVSYMCDAIGCGRVFRGSHVNLLQHVDKCRGGKR